MQPPVYRAIVVINMSEKVIGYILLTVGLVVICLAALNIFQTFTGTLVPYSLFNSQSVSLDLGTLVPGQSGKMELFSAKDINLISNLTIHYLLMTFIVSVGYKVASLGIQLLRPISVKLNQKS